MKKNDNIFVKLHIEKNRDSGSLALNVHFDSETPNFFVDRNNINWYPTPEELEFVNEAFGLVSKNKPKRKNHSEKKTSNHTDKEKKDNYSNSQNEKTSDQKSQKDAENNQENKDLSDSEKKDVNEWFV